MMTPINKLSRKNAPTITIRMKYSTMACRWCGTGASPGPTASTPNRMISTQPSSVTISNSVNRAPGRWSKWLGCRTHSPPAASQATKCWMAWPVRGSTSSSGGGDCSGSTRRQNQKAPERSWTPRMPMMEKRARQTRMTCPTAGIERSRQETEIFMPWFRFMRRSGRRARRVRNAVSAFRFAPPETISMYGRMTMTASMTFHASRR
mmetsp:Transcript_4858/g.11353  ORF Transcript_4858/g.11353 Transcript_4858/m.11353 type:complete len:206 (-) Transcript_4858:2725-3342(-)